MRSVPLPPLALWADKAHPPRLPRIVVPWCAALLTGALGACTSAERRVALDVPVATAPTNEARIGEEVARLLSGDAKASEAAARALSGLDDDGRSALAAHAAKISRETDPRWWSVLEENGLGHLVDASGPAARVDLLVWQASRDDARLVWRAQSGLLDVARLKPDLLIAKLRDPASPARDAVAVALADARETRAIPALVELYRAARTPAERMAATLALGRLAGAERQPRADATPAERERDADRVLAWYRTNGADDAVR